MLGILSRRDGDRGMIKTKGLFWIPKNNKKDKWDLLKEGLYERIEKVDKVINEITSDPEKNMTEQNYSSFMFGRKFQLEETLEQMEKLTK